MALYATNSVYNGAEETIGMTAAELKNNETEQQRIERWRADELERAGFDRSAAATLAARPDIDLHVAIDLVRAGCEPDLAVQILL